MDFNTDRQKMQKSYIRSERKLDVREKEFSPMHFTAVAGKAATKKNI